MRARISIRAITSFATFLLVISACGYQIAAAKRQQGKITRPIQIPEKGKLIPTSLDAEAQKEAEKWYRQFFNTTWSPGAYYTLVRDIQYLGPEEKKRLPILYQAYDENHRLTLREIRGWQVTVKRTLDLIDRQTAVNEPDLQWRGELHFKHDWVRQWPPREGQNPDAPGWSPLHEWFDFYTNKFTIEKRANQPWNISPRPDWIAPTDEQLERSAFKWNDRRISKQVAQEIEKRMAELQKKYGENNPIPQSVRDIDDLERKRVMQLNPAEHANLVTKTYLNHHFAVCDNLAYTVEITRAPSVIRRMFEKKYAQAEESHSCYFVACSSLCNSSAASSNLFEVNR